MIFDLHNLLLLQIGPGAEEEEEEDFDSPIPKTAIAIAASCLSSKRSKLLTVSSIKPMINAVGIPIETVVARRLAAMTPESQYQ